MDLTPFVNAIRDKHWALLTGLIVFVVVGFAKQGWFSSWVATKLTAQSTQWFALSLSLLTTVSGDLINGRTWQTAIMDAVIAFMVAISSHQVIIENLRKGEEIIRPTRKTMASRITRAIAGMYIQ